MYQQPSHTIPEEKIGDFRECFDWFDKDGDGKIQGADLSTAVRVMGQYWTFGELRQLAIEYPPSRAVSFEEFLLICSRKYGITVDRSSIDKAFDVFDRNRSGEVLIDDLKHVLTSVGEKLTIEEFEELCQINHIPYTGGRQRVNKKQFLSLFSGSNS